MTDTPGLPGALARQPRNEQYGPFFAWCVLTVLALATGLVVLSSELAPTARETTSQVMLTAGGILVAISCGRRIRGIRERRSRAWLFLACAGLLCALANLYELLVSLGGPRTTTGVGDVGLSIALVVGIAGILSFPTARRRRTDLARMVLDGVVIGGSVLFLTVVVVYPPLLTSEPIQLGADLPRLILPLGDVVVATVAVLLIIRSATNERPALTLVSIGFSLYAVSDLAMTVLKVADKFSFGTIVDLGWITGYALIALAGRHPAAARPQTSDHRRETSPIAGTVIMFAIFIAAGIVGLSRPLHPLATLLWLVVLVAIAARQILLIIDNNKFYRSLARRVDERTRDLQRLTEQSELLLRSVGDGIYGVDEAGRITFVNPTAAQVLGYKPEDLIERPAHRTFHAPSVEGKPFPESQCYVTEAVRDGFATISEEDIYLRADGRQIPVEVTATPLTATNAATGAQLSTRGAVVVFRDITQRHELDRIKNEFVSMISHELRTPLTSIRGSLGLLSGGALGPLPPRAKQLLTIAQDSCERLTRLINDILDIERFESGNIPIEISELRAGQLIGDAVRQVELVATEARIRLSVAGADGVVMADADWVLQALINLIGNAIKFSQPGDEVVLAAVPRGGFVEFSITDHGRGIPPDKLERIFNRFEQVDSSDSRDKGGSGLGLAISRSIVERQGGRIWARSDPERGTVFTFTLPRAEGSVARTQVDQPTVLVCDDDDYAVEVMCRLLEARGFRTVGFNDGRQAIERALSDPPAAVVVDLVMPGTSGSDVIAALGRHTITRALPVIVVSGLSPSGNPTLARQVAGWLVKPIDEDRLVHTVRTALAHRLANTVLLLESDDDLAAATTMLLQRRGLTVQHVHTVEAALARVDESTPELIIMDLRLRDLHGGDLLTVLRQRGATGTPIVAYSDDISNGVSLEPLPGGRSVRLTRGSVTAQQLEDTVIDLLDSIHRDRQRLASATTPAARRAVLDPTAANS